MTDKQYKSIKEVSDQLKINKHVIRYWDSKFEGISTRLSDTKRRFFSVDNIKKIQDLKNVLYQNGKHNYSLELANKIVNKKSSLNKLAITKIEEKSILDINILSEISKNLKKLLKL